VKSLKVKDDKINFTDQSSIINLIFVGRLAEPKKPELLIDAIAGFPEDIKQRIKFTIIGDGVKRKDLENLAINKKVGIEFKGTLDKNNVFEELDLADIFVFISAWEGFPYTILEGMSCGLPIIASDVGGVEEAVSEKNGILVKNEVGQIREAILKLIRSKELRLKLGQQGKKDVIEKFSLEQMLNKIENIYNTII
jgi:glycosyltransferase involved in cell wall biosynthesis